MCSETSLVCIENNTMTDPGQVKRTRDIFLYIFPLNVFFFNKCIVFPLLLDCIMEFDTGISLKIYIFLDNRKQIEAFHEINKLLRK